GTEDAGNVAAKVVGETVQKVSDFATQVPKELVDKFVEHVKANSDKLAGTALDEAVETHLNMDRIVTSKSQTGLHNFALNASDKLIQEMSDGRMNLDLLKDEADARAEIYGGNPSQMFA